MSFSHFKKEKKNHGRSSIEPHTPNDGRVRGGPKEELTGGGSSKLQWVV